MIFSPISIKISKLGNISSCDIIGRTGCSKKKEQTLGLRVQWQILATMFENRQREENYSKSKVPTARETYKKTATDAWDRLKTCQLVERSEMTELFVK